MEGVGGGSFNEQKYKGLLEGLEVSEVLFIESLGNKDFRMDSDFWTKQPKKNPRLIYKKIGDILQKSQYGISVSMNEENNGYPIYRMNEIHNMLCDLSVDKFADISKDEFLKFELNDRDVLFNRTNSFEWVGRTGVYYQNDEIKKTFASYLVRFNPDENIILPEYLATFLSSKQGVWDVKRRARPSINQTNVNPEEVKQIEIPIMPMDFQKEIKSRFEKANNDRILSQQIYRQAEELLLETIGLKDFTPSQEKVNVKSFKESFLATGRLDAEYYQPKYEEIIDVVKNYKNGFANFESFIDSYSTGYPYKSETYIEDNGIPLVRINNLTKEGLDLSNAIHIPKEDLNLSKKDIAKENDILISMSGTIGLSCIVREKKEIVINQRIMRITSKNYNPLVLSLLLNSIVGKYQLERIGTGGVQTNISSTDIKNIVIPIIESETQQQISALIQESFALRKESERLLVEAKEMVEREIEKN